MAFNFLKKLLGSDGAEDGEPSPSPNSPPSPQAEAPPEDRCFRERVDTFWEWFAAREIEFYDELQEKRIDANALAKAFRALAPSIAFETGSGADDQHHGLAISAEADGLIRPLVRYVVQRAPPLTRWTIFASKQPEPTVASMAVQLGDSESLEFSDYRFSLDFDPERQKLDVDIYHPSFAKLPESVRGQLVFIALDNALGENLVASWVGYIEILTEATDAQKYTIEELRRQVRAALSLHDLDADLDPLDLWMTYRLQEPGDGDLVARADILTGTTSVTALFNLDAEGEARLADTGADYAYVMFPRSDLAEGSEIEQRGQLSDLASARLRACGAGDFVGGAFGMQYSYSDFILFDEAKAKEVLTAVVAELPFISRASLRFFASSRANERVELK